MERKIEIIVPVQCDDLRVDVFLVENCADIPTRSAAQKALLAAGIPKSRKVKAGEVLELTLSNPAVPHSHISNLQSSFPLDIVYEDDHMLVIDKPKGLVVHPGAGNPTGTLVDALLAHTPLSAGTDPLRPGIVHRLDKDTSGLLVAAKTDAAHAHLSAQLERREMGRLYRGIIFGHPKLDEYTINAPIRRHPRDRTKMTVAPRGLGREAVTYIRVLERYTRRGKFSLIEAKLGTGRTHQIRVHAASIGHPVLGDAVYGPKKPALGLTSQVLHAYKLSLTHPATYEVLSFTSPLPSYFTDVLERVTENAQKPARS